MKYKYTIGIDPGEKTGFAIRDNKAGKIWFLKAVSFWTAVDMLRAHKDRFDNYFIVNIEDVTQLKPTFPKKGAAGLAVISKISQNVGSVKRDCQLLMQYMDDTGIKYNRIRPGSVPTKLDAKAFKAYTGWDGPSNEHSRDAGILTLVK